MSAVIDLVQTVEKLGIELRVDGGELRISAPKGTLTDELLTELKKHKQELLNLERWTFRHLGIPSQLTLGKVDIWLVGEQRNADTIMICFVRTEEWSQSIELRRENASRETKQANYS